MIQCYRWVVRDRETNKPVATVVGETEQIAKSFLKYQHVLAEKIETVEVFFNGSARVRKIEEACYSQAFSFFKKLLKKLLTSCSRGGKIKIATQHRCSRG